MKSINLIARDNGAGLSRDLELLARHLRSGGHDVTVTALGHRGRLSRRLQRLWARWRRAWRGWRQPDGDSRYDINLMIEHVRPEFFEQARCNVLIPNPEWFKSEWRDQLPGIDHVLVKTRHAERIFGELGCSTHFIGFTGEDCREPAGPRELAFFHGPGRSGNKGTLALLRLWAEHPEWPRLTVVWRRKRVELPPLPANVTLHRDYLATSELRRLQNTHGFHLCPSQTEGYGHSLVESLSVGAVTLSVDAEPMNELVTPERGVLVDAHEAGKQELATLYDFDAESMRQAIERCRTMPDAERETLGRAARAWYEANDAAFVPRLLRVIDQLAPATRR